MDIGLLAVIIAFVVIIALASFAGWRREDDLQEW